MTEPEWLSSVHPVPMLDHLRPAAGGRKLLLFAVACCRRVWPHIPDERSRRAVDVMEASVDGHMPNAGLRDVADAAHRAAAERPRHATRRRSYAERAAEYGVLAACMTMNRSSIWGHATAAYMAAYGSADCSACAAKFAAKSVGAPGRPGAKGERRVQAALARDIFGNPFRPAAFAAAWLTSDVLGLARAVYGSGDFSPMPVLADALQDAGCDDPDILGHCRAGGPHVRGCWVVDRLLGKG